MAFAYENIHNGVVLSELAGYSNGNFCAKHGAGAALVMLGTYIIAPHKPISYPTDFIIEKSVASYNKLLRKEIGDAGLNKANVGVSVAGIDLTATVDFCQAAEEAGADYIALCLHSTFEVFMQTNTSAALCYRRNWDSLREWASNVVSSVSVPVIFKLGANDTPDTVQAAGVISTIGNSIIHVDCQKIEEGSFGLGILKEISRQAPFVIASGGIEDIDGARRALNAGASAVGIGKAAIKNPLLCKELQQLLLRNDLKK